MTADRAPISAKQWLILDFIAEHIDEYGWAPSFREIGKAAELRSTSTISWHLSVLEARGYLKRQGFSPRAMAVIR